MSTGGLNINAEALKRFEEICRLYLNGSWSVRKTILSCFDENEQKILLEGIGLYHMFTDERYYKIICKSLGEQLYEELHNGKSA